MQDRAYRFSWIKVPEMKEMSVPTGLTYFSMWLKVNPGADPSITYSTSSPPYSVAYAGLCADPGSRNCILLRVCDVDGNDLYTAPDQVIPPIASPTPVLDLILRFQGATTGYGGTGNLSVFGGSFRLSDVSAAVPGVAISLPMSSSLVPSVQQVELVGSNTSNPVWTTSNQPQPVPPYVPPGRAPSHRDMHSYNGNTTRLRAEAGEWVPLDETNYLPPGCREWVDMTETEAYQDFIGHPVESKRDGEVEQVVVRSAIPVLNEERLTALFPNELAAAVSRYVFGVAHHNIWNDLPLDESDALDGGEADAPPPLVLAPPVPSPQPAAPAGPAAPPKDGHPPASVPKTPPPSPKLDAKPGLDLVKQRKSALKRIVGRLVTPAHLIDWLLTCGPTVSWANAVADLMWGNEWRVRDLTAAQFWFQLWARHKVAGLKERDMREVFASWAKDSFPGWGEKVEREFNDDMELQSPGWWAQIRVLETERDAHNREMHSIHGNPVVVADMKGVEAMPRLAGFVETKVDAASRFDGARIESTISGLVSSNNPTDARLSFGTTLRSRGIDPAGVMHGSLGLPMPETTMKPREVYNAVLDQFDPSPYPLRWVTFSASAATGLPMVSTPFWQRIGEKNLRDEFQVGRNDTVCVNSFAQMDVNRLGQMDVPRGLDMSIPILKLKLWHKVATWMAGAWRYLPISNDLRMDPGLQTAPLFNADPDLATVNAGAVASENLGGLNAHFPFAGGRQGTVTFHVSMETVPGNELGSLIVAPKSMHHLFDTRGKGIAMLVAMFAPWPFCMVNIPRRVVPAAGAAAFTIGCTPYANTVYVPGYLDMHVLLPREISGRVPTDQATANAYVFERPRYGSVGIPGHLPFDDINLGWIAGGVVRNTAVPLAPFLRSWFNDITFEDLAFFVTSMSRMADMSCFMNVADERVAMSAVRYVPMTTAVAPVLSPYTMAEVCPDGHRAGVCPAGGFAYPYDMPNTPEYFLPDFDNIAWNHLALGTRKVEALPPVRLPMSVMMTRPHNVYWSCLQARSFAFARHYELQTIRIPAISWDHPDAFGAVEAMREYVLATYGSKIEEGTYLHARSGPMRTQIYAAVNGCNLYRDQYGNTVYDYCLQPPNGYVSIHDGQAVPQTYPELVPIFLPNIYLQVQLNTLPQSMVPFPPNNGLDATCGMVDEDMSMIQIGALRGPPLRRIHKGDRLDDTDLPDWDDPELWNLRVMDRYSRALGVPWTCRTRSSVMVNMTYAPVLLSAPAIWDEVMAGMVVATGSEWAHSVEHLPLVNDAGDNLFYVMDAIASTRLSRIMLGVERLSVHCLLLAGASASSALLWSKSKVVPRQMQLMQRLLSAGNATCPGDIPLIVPSNIEASIEAASPSPPPTRPATVTLHLEAPNVTQQPAGDAAGPLNPL